METTREAKMENVLLVIFKTWISGKYIGLKNHERCSWSLGCIVSFGLICFGTLIHLLDTSLPRETLSIIMGVVFALLIIPLQILNAFCHQHHGETVWQSECWTFGNCIVVAIPGFVNIGAFATIGIL
ncbi:MAG: hypothetical protein O2904_03195 [bacterium]|nr:hypothetical protein [bacterium]